MIFHIRPLSPPQRPGSAPSPEKRERGGVPQFLGGAQVACVEAPAPWRVTLPVDAAAVPPGPHLGPLPSSSTPLCVRGWGHRPQVGRRAGWRGERVWTLAGLSRPCLAGRSSCRRRRRPRPSASPERDPSGSDSPSARSGEGTGRAGQGLCGQHSSQHLWTAAWSESGRCGFVALACCSVDSSLTRLPSLPAAQRLEPGYPRSVRRPERAMTVRWLGPRMQELARWMVVRQAGDAHLLVCGKDDIYTCKLWL